MNTGLLILWAGRIAVLVGTFFLGGAVYNDYGMNPWQIGLTATSLGIILLAIHRTDRRGEDQGDKLMDAIDESTEAVSTYTGARFDQIHQLIRNRGSVTAVSGVRNTRGNGGDAA